MPIQAPARHYRWGALVRVGVCAHAGVRLVILTSRLTRRGEEEANLR